MPKYSEVHLTKDVVEDARPGQCISDNVVRGFRLLVSPHGTKRFVASFRVHGRSSMKALGSFPALTVEEARKRAREVLDQAWRGVRPADAARAAKEADEAARTAPTMSDLASVYLDDYATSRGLRPATVRHARGLLAKVLPTIGNWKVADVTADDIAKLHGDVRAAGIKAGNKGVYQANRLLAVLSKMFSLARRKGWRPDNPCASLDKFDEHPRWNNLNEREVERLLAACDDYERGLRPLAGGGAAEVNSPKRNPLVDREAADAIRLLLLTGARLQEVLKAEWSQFDLERGLWIKPASYTKTKREQRLELEGPALELLRSMQERGGRDPTHLFPGNASVRRSDAPVDINTGKPLTKARADLRHPWRAIRAMAGLEGVRLHDLRRTLASFMLSSGASLATVGKTLGHTQPGTTARYATLAPSVQKAALGEAGRQMMRGGGRTPSGAIVAFPEASK